ncbi:hypothetical protein CCR75_007293 [Bremia lactucae]|uniref:Uncharacterized protein n=1 Tax=Bremia lactucae TaxID=4779 RepID=A0A976FQR0_BRELC|nr:hypothetical protein CCR75_007293 [Bremia lactucae]
MDRYQVGNFYLRLANRCETHGKGDYKAKWLSMICRIHTMRSFSSLWNRIDAVTNSLHLFLEQLYVRWKNDQAYSTALVLIVLNYNSSRQT